MAEVTAIKKAVNFAFHRFSYKEVRIISDSLSSILPIINLNGERLIFDEIRQQIRIQENINIEWISAYVDNPGNELADMMAKNALDSVVTDIEYYMNN